MDLTIKRLRKVLQEKFPGAETELERFPGTKKIGGYLIWDGFEDLEQLERHQSVSQALRESLGEDYRTTVTTILTITPAENMVMREG